MKILRSTVLIVCILTIFSLVACSRSPTASGELKFISNGDGTCYVDGIGTYTGNSITIPNTSPKGDKVVAIGHRAFANNLNITNVIIPPHVTAVSEYAFYGCINLESIEIQGSGVKIGRYAFSNTAYYNTQKNWEFYTGIVNGEEKTYYYAIYIGKNLIDVNCNDTQKSFSVKNGTIGIADYAFYNCNKLTSVTIPNSVLYIGEHAFYGCNKLNSAFFEEQSNSYTVYNPQNNIQKSINVIDPSANAENLSQKYVSYIWKLQ